MWFDAESARRALKLANEEAAAVLLKRESALAKLIPDVSSISRMILRREWAPYETYEDSDGNWGLQLRTDDWLVRIAMRDDETYTELRAIGNRILFEQITTPEFMTQMLERVILDGEGHDNTN